MVKLFQRSAHSAGPRSFPTQCCLRVVSVEVLARWLLLRFLFLSLGSFGWSFFALGRCLLGSFGAFWAALGGFFWVSEAPLGSREGPLGSLWGSLGGVGVSLGGRVAFCVPPGVGSGKIREILGGILAPFWKDFS